MYTEVNNLIYMSSYDHRTYACWTIRATQAYWNTSMFSVFNPNMSVCTMNCVYPNIIVASSWYVNNPAYAKSWKNRINTHVLNRFSR